LARYRTLGVMAAFDLPGALRRIRRTVDLSQRELARQLGTSKTTVAAVEAGSRGLDATILARAAQLAGLRLVLLDGDDREVQAMTDEAVRDALGRRFPAHLDTRYGDIDWWHGGSRYNREQPWYTFDRVRETRDFWRERFGTPEDHQLPQPGDSPAERRAARQRAAREEQRREVERRREAGELPEREPFTCECPPACDELDDWSGKPVHAPECPCGCDLG
jgi:HTH-type transcriptional regulator/antitoxin HipB